MKALVTGATGFLGGALARRLKGMGWDVTALGRNSFKLDELESEGIDTFQLDITKKDELIDACKNQEIVFHCGKALQERDATERASVEREKAERMLAGIIDVFNTGIDNTIDRGQEVIPELADLALVKETEEQKKQVVDYAALSAKAITERNFRIAEFQRRFRSGQ